MFEKTIEIIKKELQKISKKDGAHDLSHFERTKNLALELQKTEGGDRLIIGVAAYIHDVHRLLSGDRKPNETAGYMSPKESLPHVQKILEKTELSGEQIDKVLHCVEYHEEYSFSEQGKTVSDIETLILQDADNLDAMGAIAIGRTFSYGGMCGIPLWAPEIPLNTNTPFEEKHPVDHSTIHHFYSKLLKLKDNMNTKTAKEMALVRHKTMLDFLCEFYKEWGGEAAEQALEMTRKNYLSP